IAGSARGTQQDYCSAEHVSCLENLNRQRISFALRRSLVGDGNALTHRTPTPAIRRSIGLPMCEKRIRPFSDFLALPGHHVDRVVQKHTANISRGLRHENTRAWKAPHCQRQRADMILMSV